MSEKFNKERPEVYALRQDGEGWQFSRRDFLKAAGIGAAVVGAGMNSRFVVPTRRSGFFIGPPLCPIRYKSASKSL